MDKIYVVTIDEEFEKARVKSHVRTRKGKMERVKEFERKGHEKPGFDPYDHPDYYKVRNPEHAVYHHPSTNTYWAKKGPDKGPRKRKSAWAGEAAFKRKLTGETDLDYTKTPISSAEQKMKDEFVLRSPFDKQGHPKSDLSKRPKKKPYNWEGRLGKVPRRD